MEGKLDRGLRAQLSPNEMTTLTRIASGERQDNLRARDLTLLYSLGLIESHDSVWCLTEIGRLRMTNDRSAAGPAP
jgi:hypothetical protein